MPFVLKGKKTPKRVFPFPLQGGSVLVILQWCLILKVNLAHSQQNPGNQPCWNYLQIQFMQSIHVSGTPFLIPAHGNLIAKFEPLSGYLSLFKDFMGGKRIQWSPALLQGLTTILTFSECKTWEPRKTWLRQRERIDSRAASFTGTFKLYSSLTQRVSAM